jgi:hypothetical protein
MGILGAQAIARPNRTWVKERRCVLLSGPLSNAFARLLRASRQLQYILGCFVISGLEPAALWPRNFLER